MFKKIRQLLIVTGIIVADEKLSYIINKRKPTGMCLYTSVCGSAFCKKYTDGSIMQMHYVHTCSQSSLFSREVYIMHHTRSLGNTIIFSPTT